MCNWITPALHVPGMTVVRFARYCPAARRSGLANASSRRSTCASTGIGRDDRGLADDHLHGAVELHDAVVEGEAGIDQPAHPSGSSA